MTDPLQLIRNAGNRRGLNLVAAIPVARYALALGPKSQLSATAPDARSIIVIGNGGGDFWLALKQHAAQHPGWSDREHPVDDYTREVIEGDIVAPVRALGLRCSVTYPFAQDRSVLNFMELGKLAGLGGPSIIGVLVNPSYGPWIAFRAALLVDADLDAPGDAAGFDPCPGCVVRSCIAACPVKAVSFPKGWDIPRCLEHRVEVEPDCASRCHARVGCVLGPEHRYPDDELAYHQMRALRAMRPYYFQHVKKS
jgi:epoxyqueuosine reductase QueG